MTLKEYRQSLSITQVQIAEKLGVPQPTYHGWESGNRTPDYKLIALKLGVEIVFGPGEDYSIQ